MFSTIYLTLTLTVMYLVGATVTARLVEMLYNYLNRAERHEIFRNYARYFPFDVIYIIICSRKMNIHLVSMEYYS
jgi:hypothetical protein